MKMMKNAQAFNTSFYLLHAMHYSIIIYHYNSHYCNGWAEFRFNNNSFKRMNFSVFTKQICRFLIQRYMGQYLRTELTSDQLELHLADGTATVQGVMLNAEYINETLEASGIRIVTIKDGYIEELTVSVPWKRLLLDSTVVKISNLQITLTPVAEVNMANTQDLVSSFIGSIASSMDLAKSVIVDEQLAGGADNAGIEQCASLIDQIISRIKVVFENVILRVESYSDLCTGIEVQIDKIEFLDEQMEEQSKNADAITEQPGRLSVTDLNKLLHIQGVRVYTDVWSPIRDERMASSRMNASDIELDSEMASSSLNFQSCYSHFSSRSNSNTSQKPHNLIPTNPILFAQLFSEKHTVRIRVNNNAALTFADNCFFNKRVDIEMFLGGPLYMFLSPSQLVLLKELFSSLLPKDHTVQTNDDSFMKFGGKPIGPEQQARLMEQMQHADSGGQRFTTFAGNWSGADQFFDLSEQIDIQTEGRAKSVRERGKRTTTFCESSNAAIERFRSNSLSNEHEKMGNRHSNASTSTLVEKRPDIFSLSIRVPALVAVLTHDDPLGMETIRKRGEKDVAAISSTIREMIERADRFFKTAEGLKIARRKLEAQREHLAGLYAGDSLRFVANGLFTTLTLVDDSQRSSLEFEGHLEECDFVECLRSDEDPRQIHVDILNLSEAGNRGMGSKNSVFTFRINNSAEKQNEYAIAINIERCKTELDLSLIDRMSNLLFAEPFFTSCKGKIQPELVTGLSDNFSLGGSEGQQRTFYHVKCYCSDWQLNLRIPIADFATEEPEYWKRKLYPEYLQLSLEGAEFELPRFSQADLAVFWVAKLKSKTAKGTFVGDPSVLQCSPEEMTFFFADASNAEKAFGNNGFKMELRYDSRNKSLSKALISADCLATRSLYESIYRASEEDKIEGPFSKDNSYFTFTDTSDFTFDRRLIMVGSKDEMLEFAEECRQQTKLTVDFTISQLNLALPNPKFYEVLYNRFANDLALWEPKSPKFKVKGAEDPSANQRQFVECQTSFLPFLAGGNGIEDYSDRPHQKGYGQEKAGENKRGDSHVFSIGVQIGRARMLLQTSTTRQKKEENRVESFVSQLGLDLLNSNIFFVYGFAEDPNLSYFFTTSKRAELLHRNLLSGAKPFCSNVLNLQEFIVLRQKDDVWLEETPKSKEHAYEHIDDDNFALAMKMHFHPENNTKDILFALGLRNSFLHLRPLSDSRLFLVNQFANFFNVQDYGVPGYVLPAVSIDLRMNFSSVFLGYDHSSILPNSLYQLRFEIGFCYLTSNMVQGIERFKFDCIFQDLKLWMRKKQPQTVKFEMAGQGAPSTPDLASSMTLVKVLHCDFIHFTLAFTVESEPMPGPWIDFACVNKSISIWLCSDTVIEFLNLLAELFRSDAIKELLSSDKASEDAQQEKLSLLVRKANEGGFPVQNSSAGSSGKIQELAHATEISLQDEERLIKMMEAAINDLPSVAKAPKESLLHGIDEETLMDEDYSSNSATTENTDDEYILIEKVASTGHHPSAKPLGVGVTKLGSHFQTHFDTGGDFEFVQTQINMNHSIPLMEHLDGIPTNLPPPLLRYKVKDVSLNIFLFGGTDFGDSPRTMSQKTYSQWNSNNLDRTRNDEIGSRGGRYRDCTVIVEFQLTKMSFACEVFNASSPFLSLIWLKIDEFKVLDHLSISQINEMVHRLEEEGRPRTVKTPFLSVRLIEDQLREATLRVSLSPMRLNLDQDTLEFLMDFKNDLIQGLRSVFDFPIAPIQHDDGDVPVMEVPRSASPLPNSSREDDGLTMSFNVLKSADEMATTDAPLNLDELFSEEDVNLSDSFCAKFSLGGGTRSPDRGDQTEICRREQHSPSSIADETSSANTMVMTPSSSLAAKETFIKDFSFSPACRLRIDYEAKRVKTDQQGALLGLLIGMTKLNKTELTLKELQVEKGFLGFGRCAQYVVDDWVMDIRTRQFPNVVGSVAPINALVQLAQGFHDLFAFPLEEFRKENGQLIRGIQRGTSSFSINAASAAIDATQRVVGLVQNVAELAYDIVNPDFAYQRQRRQLAGPSRVQVAGDLREGLSMAYNTVREGVMDTAQTLQAAAEEERALGGWGMGILRHMTPSAIKPIVLASKATSHVLGGLKNQLRPEDHKEEMRKWRQNQNLGNNRQNVDQLRRQTSSSSMASSSSSASFTRNYEMPPQRRNW